MNVDDSGQSTSCGVKSKYFATKSAMDESLYDFKETKKSCTGPKTIAKTKVSKPRKGIKKLRGQKDIRKALQVRNELESYSKDFDRVCKKAGIDVNPEQLQLAIALSKSIQDTTSTSTETAESSKVVNTQDRIGKIRTTLQEYGFKVPEIKITATNIRKPRKSRKNYKLILSTAVEKKQIIADKYSQVLFQNITHCNLYECDVDVSNIQLYYLASNVPYEILKSEDIFYVGNLVEASPKAGTLLKDWSGIPGRPVSPKLFDSNSMNFSEIDCSQDELDIILSGSLKSCKNMVSKKKRRSFHNDACKVIVEINNVSANVDVNKEGSNKNDHEKSLTMNNDETEHVKVPISVEKHCRSYSPDIFDDDDASYICNESKNLTIHIESLHSPTKINIEEMDLTECVQKTSQPHSNSKKLSLNKVTKKKSNASMEVTESLHDNLKYDCTVTQGSQLSQNSNITKRKSNDFMEMTKCVTNLTPAEPIQDEIDLTQSPDIVEDNTKNNNSQNLDASSKINTNISDSSVNIISSAKDTDVDLRESQTNCINTEPDNEIMKNPEVAPEKSIESMDLTQSSNTSDELPFISLSGRKANSLDDTIIIDVNDYAIINKRSNLQSNVEVHIDLTQYSEKNDEVNAGQSFFEEYVHDHSDYNEESAKSSSSEAAHKQCSPSKVALTQSPIKNLNSNKGNEEPGHNEDPNISLIHSNYKELTPVKVNHILKKSPSNISNVYEESTINNIQEHFTPSNPQPEFDKVDFTQSSGENFEPEKHLSLNSIDDPVGDSEKYVSYSGNTISSRRGKINHSLSPIRKPTTNNDEMSDIDLTQNSGSSEDFDCKMNSSQSTVNNTYKNKELNTKYSISAENNEKDTSTKSQSLSSLGKMGDVSIDYDELYCNKGYDQNSLNNKSKSVIYEVIDENIKETVNNGISNSSQISEVFEISDRELNYSLHRSKLEKPGDSVELEGISIMEDLSDSLNKSVHDNNSGCDANDEEMEKLPTINITETKRDNRCNEISPIKHRRITEIATPLKACSSNMIHTVVTPKNSELIIKTNNVTPMLDYESMSTPEIHSELDKYGIKPFKRKRAIKLLTYIYNQTHPVIETCTDVASPPKKRKLNEELYDPPRKRISPRQLLKSPSKGTNRKENNHKKSAKDSSENLIENSRKGTTERTDLSVMEMQSTSKETVCQTSDKVPIVKDIECKPEDWVFQKREKAKMPSCRVPLHIAFYNYVHSSRDLRESILCYEPVNIDDIHKDLVGYGHRYDPKDLLKFLDKKCITVKTTDNDARNHRKLS